MINLIESKKVRLVIVGLVILLAGILRIYNLEADPDKEIDGDPGIFSDEGLYSLTARNLALFKTLNPHKPNLIIEKLDNPLYTFAEYLSFRAFGVNIKALRIPSVVFSLIILIVTYHSMLRLFGHIFALLAVTFLGFNFMFIQYNRLALVETLLSLLVLISYYMLLATEAPSKKRVFFSGLFYGLAVITKGTAFFFLPGFLLAIALGNMDGNWLRKNISNIASFVVGIAVILVMNKIYLFLLVRYLTDIGSNTALGSYTLIGMGKAFFVEGSVGDWLKNLTQILGSRFSLRTPGLFFICYLSTFWLIATCKRPLTFQDRGKLLLGLWFLSGILFMSFFSYGPNRYRVPLMLPVCMLSAIVISELQSLGKERFRLVWSMRVASLGIIAFGLITFRIIRISTIVQGFEWNNNIIGIVAFSTAAIFVLASWHFLPSEVRVCEKLKKAIIPCFLVLFLVYQLTQYFRWRNYPTYNIRNGNKEVERIVRGGIVGGVYAPIFCFETKEIAIPLWEPNRSNLRKLGLTHYLDCVDGEFNAEFMIITREYPDFIKNIKWVHDVNLGNYTVSLYSINKGWSD